MNICLCMSIEPSVYRFNSFFPNIFLLRLCKMFNGALKIGRALTTFFFSHFVSFSFVSLIHAFWEDLFFLHVYLSHQRKKISIVSLSFYSMTLPYHRWMEIYAQLYQMCAIFILKIFRFSSSDLCFLSNFDLQMSMAKVSKTEPKSSIITLNYDFLNTSNSPLFI